MNATHYWLFAREYAIWNAAVSALQFWMNDCKPHTLSVAIEKVYTTFFLRQTFTATMHIT